MICHSVQGSKEGEYVGFTSREGKGSKKYSCHLLLAQSKKQVHCVYIVYMYDSVVHVHVHVYVPHIAVCMLHDNVLHSCVSTSMKVWTNNHLLIFHSFWKLSLFFFPGKQSA